MVLRYLYPKLSVGGYLIVDDYGALSCCAKAVDRFREDHGITEKVIRVDYSRVFWKKEKHVASSG